MNPDKKIDDEEYEKTVKHLQMLKLKKLLNEEGIDTSKVPQKQFDELRRIMDRHGPIHQKYQKMINDAQEEASLIITMAQKSMKDELATIKKEAEDIVLSIKIEQGIIKPPEGEAAEQKPEAGQEAEGGG